MKLKSNEARKVMMQSTKILSIFLMGALISCKGDKTVTPPPPPEPHLVTFQGQAFLDGQPKPVNALNLPLHYDIQIISYLPGDTASYDTVYTDSSGVYISTRLRYDGTYTILSQYPYYRTDSVRVEVKNGQVIGGLPDLHSQRLLKMEIFPDSTVYHSLQSEMFFQIIMTNLNCDSTIWIFPCDGPEVSPKPGAVAVPTDYAQIIVPKEEVYNWFSAFDPNETASGCLPACQHHRTGVTRLLINFYDRRRNKSPETGTYYLYVYGQNWPRASWYPHYGKVRHWYFKVCEPTLVEVKLE